MQFKAILISSLALAVCHVSAINIRKNSGLGGNLGGLLRRQDTNACIAACTAYEDSLDSCLDISCICSSVVAKNLQTCVSCAVAATSATIPTLQGIVDAFGKACSGFSIPTVTVPSGGVSTSRLVSASGSGSSIVSSRATTSGGITGPTTTISDDLPFPSTITQIIIRPSSSTSSSAADSSTTAAGLGGSNSAASRNSLASTVLMIFSAVVGAGLVL